MTTSVTFAGSAISGIAIQRSPARVVVARQEQRLFGLPGATSITGDMEPSNVDVVLWLTGYASAAAISTYITTLESIARAGTTGTLAFSGDWNDSYPSTQMESVERIKFAGQDGPLPNDPDQAVNKWTEFVRLRFRRLA